MAEGREFFTRQTAQVVANDMAMMMGMPDEFAEVEIISYDFDFGGREVLHPSLWLRPTEEDVVTIADDSEIVQCITRDSRRASIFFGHPEEREMRPARIILGGYAESAPPAGEIQDAR